nr:MAG: hypothetical protein [Bacteriophage sp.]
MNIKDMVDHAAAVRSLTEARGVAATRGHCAGQMGLRGHSVGGVFPCVMFQQGNPNTALTYGFISPDGVEHAQFGSWEDAYSAAQEWLEQREVLYER